MRLLEDYLFHPSMSNKIIYTAGREMDRNTSRLGAFLFIAIFMPCWGKGCGCNVHERNTTYTKAMLAQLYEQVPLPTNRRAHMQCLRQKRRLPFRHCMGKYMTIAALLNQRRSKYVTENGHIAMHRGPLVKDTRMSFFRVPWVMCALPTNFSWPSSSASDSGSCIVNAARPWTTHHQPLSWSHGISLIAAGIQE
jgi:hypothetical protein